MAGAIRRIAALVAALLVAGPALAQWQVPTNSVPIGRGAGKTGFNSATVGTGLTVSSGALKLTNTGVTAGTYGDGTHCVTATVDAQGRITGLSQATCTFNNSSATTQDFIGGTDYTAGTTTSLTLSSAPSTADMVRITFDGVLQAKNTWSLSTATVTFAAAIPANVQVVEAQWYTPTVQAGVLSLGGIDGLALCGTGIKCDTGTKTVSLPSYLVPPPGGRLTLLSGVAVPNVDTPTAPTLFYTCYNSPTVPIPNGTQFVPFAIANCNMAAGLSASHILVGGSSFTASIAGASLTTSGTVTGTILVNQEITGSGIPPGLQISSIVGGGLYGVNYGTSAFTAGISGTTLAVSGITSLYNPTVGQVITAGAASGTKIISVGSVAGTYVVSISQTVAPGTSMTAATSASSVSMTGTSLYAYNAYIINNNGTAQLCVSPAAWTLGSQSGQTISYTLNSSTVEQIHNTLGYWTNVSSLSHCWGGSSGTNDFPVSADNALHVGAIMASANGQTAMVAKPNAATAGATAFCGVYNDYNQVAVNCKSQDSTSEWQSFAINNAGLPNYWPCNFVSNAAHNYGLQNRISFVDALGQQEWSAFGMHSATPVDTSGQWAATTAFALDRNDFATTAGGQGQVVSQPGFGSPSSNTGAVVQMAYTPYPTIGAHYLQCIESSGNTSYFADDFSMIWMTGHR